MTWTFGDFHLDPDRFQLARGGAVVRVEPQVLALLICLVRNRDRMVTKDELVAEVWQGHPVSDASISSRVRSARHAVADDGARQEVIRTVHGRGFRFVGEVAAAAPAGAAASPRAVDGIAPAGAGAANGAGGGVGTRTDNEAASGAGAGAAAAEPAPDLPGGRPSIAVLPFQPLGASPDLGVLGEAIPHEIIEALSRLRWLAVIARGSSFRFGRAGADLDLVATALSARYLLTGIVESRSAGLAVTLELTETRSRQVLWADRLEAPHGGIDELRSRIVAHLVAALEMRIPFHEASVAELRGPDGLDAWSNYHLGLRHLYRFTAGDTALARTCFERAVAADPGFARAHAGLSFTSFLSAFLRLGPDVAAATVAARRHAERALDLDALDPFANFTMGRSFWLTGQPEAAAEWLARATTLNPNYAQGFYASGFTAMLSGDAARTLDALDTSLHLSPLDPLLYGVHGVRAQMLMQQEDHAAAARWGDRAATLPGAHYLIAMIALAANGLAGQHEQAARWRQEVRRRKPDATAADYFAAFPTRHAASRAEIAAELRRHGF